MPRVYLSPSLQPGNMTALGFSEQYFMNILADAIEPLLPINGITYRRSRIGMTLTQVVADSNSEPFDFHLALHSNASPPAAAGQARGSRMYFFTTSANGRRFSEFAADEIKKIYPLPDKVGLFPTTGLLELNATRAPAAIIETVFHDNYDDAEWLSNNIQNMAEAIVKALCRYLGKASYIPPCSIGHIRGTNYVFTKIANAFVCTETSPLNIRSAPNGAVLFTLPRNTPVLTLSGRQNGFIKIRRNMREGFASESFLCVCNIAFLPFDAKTGTVSTAGGNLNLRQSPSASAPILTVMPNGSSLVILSRSGDFYQVNFNGVTGFASVNFVR